MSGQKDFIFFFFLEPLIDGFLSYPEMGGNLKPAQVEGKG
jgi:hypothetical protein